MHERKNNEYITNNQEQDHSFIQRSQLNVSLSVSVSWVTGKELGSISCTTLTATSIFCFEQSVLSSILGKIYGVDMKR